MLDVPARLPGLRLQLTILAPIEPPLLYVVFSGAQNRTNEPLAPEGDCGYTSGVVREAQQGVTFPGSSTTERHSEDETFEAGYQGTNKHYGYHVAN